MKVGNNHISLTFAVEAGVSLRRIRDEAAGREHLGGEGTMLFELASQNGPPRQSDRTWSSTVPNCLRTGRG